MDNTTYLFVAFLITWLVLAGYLWSIGRQVKNLREEMDALAEEEALQAAEERAASQVQRGQAESSQA